MIPSVPPLHELEELILAKMYEHMLTSDDSYLFLGGIQILFAKNQLTLPYMQQGLSRLIRKKMLKQIDGLGGGPAYRLTEEAVEVIQSQLATIEMGAPTTTLTQYLLEDTVDKNIAPQAEIPASDRIVSLNHNSPDYKRATKEFDAVTEAIRGKNDIDPETKEELLTDLSVGRALLGHAKVWANLLQSWTLGVLRKVVQKVQDEGIKALATGAIEALKQLFKAWIS